MSSALRLNNHCITLPPTLNTRLPPSRLQPILKYWPRLSHPPFATPAATPPDRIPVATAPPVISPPVYDQLFLFTTLSALPLAHSVRLWSTNGMQRPVRQSPAPAEKLEAIANICMPIMDNDWSIGCAP